MRWSLPLILSLLPLGGLAGKRSQTCKQKSLLKPNTTKTGKYRLRDNYQGKDFLDKWDFFTGQDPTSGQVTYQSKQFAMNNNLAVVDNGALILSVDDTTWGNEGLMRNSVRIGSPNKYNGGLFIADFKAMPFGCSVWPAYWTVGADNWPINGEVDVVEGVNNQHTNLMTVHTGAGCSMPRAGNAGLLSCESTWNSNSGCSVTDPSFQSYGEGFNAAGGGVFAHTWTNNGIHIWHFPRNNIPQDITAKNPDPTQWGTPAATFPSTHCDIPSHFRDHSIVLDTTLCGQYAGNVYPSSGCPGTCSSAVADPTNFKNAKWIVNSISVYDCTGSGC